MFNKTIKLSIAGALAAVAGASSAAVFQFSTAPLGVVPSNTFNADQIVFSALNPSTITITDTNGDGLLGGPGGDTGVETGLVQFVNFRLGGVGVLPGLSGIDVNYQMFAVYDGVNGGPLVGNTTLNGSDVVTVFQAPTNARIYLDSGVLNGAFDLGTSTLIANLTLDTTFGAGNNCVNPNLGSNNGSCVINFDMNGAPAGVWTVGATDLAAGGGKMRVDLNVDQLSPPLSAIYPGGIGSSQSTTVDHDGSARISVVPEPMTLALLGMGLLGVRRFTRKAA